MEVYLQSLGVDVWHSTQNGYQVPETRPMDATDRILYKNNARAMNAILCVQADSEFPKVMQCTSAKDMWDKLKNIYEGDDKVKKVKL